MTHYGAPIMSSETRVRLLSHDLSQNILESIKSYLIGPQLPSNKMQQKNLYCSTQGCSAKPTPLPRNAASANCGCEGIKERLSWCMPTAHLKTYSPAGRLLLASAPLRIWRAPTVCVSSELRQSVLVRPQLEKARSHLTAEP